MPQPLFPTLARTHWTPSAQGVVQARICFFSARAITLYEELTLDYGPGYLATLPQCCCGRAQCVKPQARASP